MNPHPRRRLGVLLPGALLLGALLLGALLTPEAALAEDRVPEVVGLDWQEAVGVLAEAGYRHRIRWREGEGAQGRVLAQTPDGASPAVRDGTVVLEVGGRAPVSAVPRPPDGPAPAAALDLSKLERGRRLDRQGPPLPSALGLLEAEGRSTLGDWKIRVEHTVGIPDLVGRVVNQVPLPGATLARGEKITLVVAVEAVPPEARVAPPLTGLALERALGELARLSLVPKLRGLPSDPHLRGHVLMQRPLPSSILGRGQEVLLLVGLGDRPDADRRPPAAPTALATPTLISPSEGQSFPVDYGSTFYWAPVAGATAYAWTLEIADDDGAFAPAGEAAVKTTRHRPARTGRGSFRWRVRALRGAERGPWSIWFRLYMY